MTAADPVPVRRTVAVLLSRFPLVTETFILREVIELERQGQPVRLVPLLREEPEVIHPEARPWLARALFTPWLSPAIVAANLRRLRRRPRRYLATLARLAAGMLPSPGFLVRSLALFPKAVYLAERLEAEGVRHLHAHYATHPATVAWVAARLAPLSYSLTVHAHDLFVDRTFLAAKLRAASWVRAISGFNRDFLVRRYPWAADRVEVVHVGVEPERYAAAPAPAGEPPLLLCVAGLKPYKGIPVLLAACEALARRGVGFRCALVGDGPQRDDVAAEVARRGLGDRVEMLGARPQHEVAALMGRAAVVVCPSVVAPDGQMEGLPVVLMEAGAAGRPVAAAALSGIPELVEGGVTGELFPPGDVEALAAAVERLLADPPRAARLGRALGERVRAEFDLRGTTARLLAGLDRHNPPPPAELVRRVRELADGGVEAVGVRAFAASADAEVADLLVVRGGRPCRAVAKRHLSRPGESAPPGERARREAEALRRLAPAAGEGFAVPRVLAADPDGALVVLSAAAGEPLDRLLAAVRTAVAGRPVRRLERLGRLAGGWLRWLQASWPVSDADGWDDADPRPALLARARRALEVAVAAGTLTRRQAVAAGRRCEALAKAAAPAAAPRHGDLWPGNLYVELDGTAGRVEGIDFEGFGPGLPEEDAAALLVHAALWFPPPLGRRRRRFEAGVLAGWTEGPGGFRPDPDRLTLCRAEAAARALAAGAAEAGTPLLRRWRRRCLRRELLGARTAR